MLKPPSTPLGSLKKKAEKASATTVKLLVDCGFKGVSSPFFKESTGCMYGQEYKYQTRGQLLP